MTAPRVACIGNPNNNLFALTRFLRDRGIDCDLLRLNLELSPQLVHFLPCADTFDTGYRAYSRDLDWGDLVSFKALNRETVARNLAPYDYIIGTSTAPAFAAAIGRRLDLFAPYGGDVDHMPFFQPRHYGPGRLLSRSNLSDNIAAFHFARAQRRGIVEAKALFINEKSFSNKVRRLGFAGPQIPFNLPIVYTTEFNPDSIGHRMEARVSRPMLHGAVDRIRALRDKHYPIIFHQARHVWRDTSHMPSVKGNDVLIRGFADFVVRQRPDSRLNPLLICCEYGPDVGASKALIAELGIVDHVIWQPLMPRRDILQSLYFVDIGANCLANSWNASGTLYEHLAMARPILHSRDDARHAHEYPELFPLMNANTPEGVSTLLDDYVARPEYYKDMGERGRRWFMTYVINAGVDAIIADLEQRLAERRS